MIRWFRRRRPVPDPPRLPLYDILTISAWGISPRVWSEMTDPGRSWHRMNITKAPHFHI